MIKLVHYAKCKDVTFFRMGTSGGVGVTPGTLIITNEAVDGMFRPEYRQVNFNLIKSIQKLFYHKNISVKRSF